jgi:hypothetical protein
MSHKEINTTSRARGWAISCILFNVPDVTLITDLEQEGTFLVAYLGSEEPLSYHN